MLPETTGVPVVPEGTGDTWDTRTPVVPKATRILAVPVIPSGTGVLGYQ